MVFQMNVTNPLQFLEALIQGDLKKIWEDSTHESQNGKVVKRPFSQRWHDIEYPSNTQNIEVNNSWHQVSAGTWKLS